MVTNVALSLAVIIGNRMSDSQDQPTTVDRIKKLELLVARLRGPDGCPWDREQTLADLRTYLLEEAHEVAAAIDGGDLDHLREELGDLLFQIVFQAHLAAEQRAFELTEVIDGVHRKMIDRHPHVFTDRSLPDAEAVRTAWEKQKVKERDTSLLSGVPSTLPALVAAQRLTQKAAGVGFDWKNVGEVVAKLQEETDELLTSLGAGQTKAAVEEEMGDLLFTAANLARWVGVDPEAVLAKANRKFKRRFQAVEEQLSRAGSSFVDATDRQLDELWEAAKRAERSGTE